MITATNKNVQEGTPEETVETNLLIDTIWNQYEKSLYRARKYRESREDAYLKSIKEVIRFNQEFRGSIANLFQASKEVNSEMLKGVSKPLFKRSVEKQAVQPELTEKFDELSNQLKQLAVTPIATGLDLVLRLENNIEENSEKLVNYSRERRHAMQKVTDVYVKNARNNHQKLVHRVEDSLKVLTNTK